MKRTVTVNISGISFVIDEDAYQLLKNYLSDIESRIDDSDKETMIDIESRIAEIFRDSGADNVRVVTKELIDDTISTIGSPFIFGEKRYNLPPIYKSEDDKPKRLTKDPNNKILGGVCSGLANYMNVDTTLIRVIAFLLFFAGTIGLWVYIIMWIIVPIDKSDKYDRLRQNNITNEK